MRRIPCLLLLAALASAPFARSQAVSIYGTFSPTHVSDVRNGGCGSCANSGYTTASFWTPGVGAGVTFNVLPIGPLRLGFDLRGSTKPGTNGTDLALFGLRLGLKAPLIPLKPYVQASGGYLGTRTNVISGVPAGSTSTDKFAAYEVMAGLDVRAVPFFDIRLIEVGAGKGYNVAGIGDTAGNYTVNFFTLNTGLVFHF